MTNQYKCEYKYSTWCGVTHTWSVVGAEGGLHVHISDNRQDVGPHKRYSGGIEIHHRHPPDYKPHATPDHPNCWLLGGPCWHDGSSLQASRFWIPLWLENQHNHDAMFSYLVKEYNTRFLVNDQKLI